jgi:flagellar basal-body rod protein FlgF
MENAILIGLTRQLTLRRALDVTANNIANMSTTGFKLERPLLAEHDAARPARADDGKRSVTFVRDWGFMRDFSPGALEHTARPFDVALAGEGFFTVQTPDGETRYTRDGRFSMNAEGQLVTSAGHLVLDDTGAPIATPPGGDPPAIVDGGAVLVNGAKIAQLGVMRFDDTAALEKAGDGTYRTDAPAQPMPDADVRAGYVENSNVNAIEEITRMIDVTRTYQSVSRMISTDEDLKRRAIEKLSSVR